VNVPAAAGKKRSSLSQGLEALLSGQILEGRLRGGEQLPTESALMLEHGVSRTVVREAMSRLQAAGMVETRHGIGTFVRGRRVMWQGEVATPSTGEPVRFLETLKA